MSVSETRLQEVLILDDEPMHVNFLIEYLESKGLASRIATNLSEAITILDSGIFFRLLVVDLNVPASGEFQEILSRLGVEFSRYPGLYFAKYARTKGYRNRQTIVYSVHDIDEVRLRTDEIGATYLTKGRPRSFKTEIDSVLGYDPTMPSA